MRRRRGRVRACTIATVARGLGKDQWTGRDTNRREHSSACVIVGRNAVAQRTGSEKALGHSIRHHEFNGLPRRSCQPGRAYRCARWRSCGRGCAPERCQGGPSLGSRLGESPGHPGPGTPPRNAGAGGWPVLLPRWARRLAGAPNLGVHRRASRVVSPGGGSGWTRRPQCEPLFARVQAKLRPGTDELRFTSASAVGAAPAADDR